MRLLIVSAAIHYEFGKQLCGYGPYAREIDAWADLFEEIVIAAPCRKERPPGDCTPFTRGNVSILPQKEVGGSTAWAKLALLAATPKLIWGLSRAMRCADAIHVRCPGNLGLLGAVIAPLFSRYIVAKYAGQWNCRTEGWTLRLQQAILRSHWWRGPVTVYGVWPNQPSHIVPFFTSVLSEKQLERARLAAQKRSAGKSLKLIYVGRLSRSKNVHVLLAAIAALKREGVHLDCLIVGEGPERQRLEILRNGLCLSDRVEFTGGVTFEKVLEFLELSDVLVLPSQTEGWPKALAEAMAFGLICIGPACGIVPEMLGQGRGFVIPSGDSDALFRLLLRIAGAPEQYAEMRLRASAWASLYSLDALRSSLRNLLVEHWRLRVDPGGRLQLEGAMSR